MGEPAGFTAQVPGCGSLLSSWPAPLGISGRGPWREVLLESCGCGRSSVCRNWLHVSTRRKPLATHEEARRQPAPAPPRPAGGAWLLSLRLSVPAPAPSPSSPVCRSPSSPFLASTPHVWSFSPNQPRPPTFLPCLRGFSLHVLAHHILPEAFWNRECEVGILHQADHSLSPGNNSSQFLCFLQGLVKSEGTVG